MSQLSSSPSMLTLEELAEFLKVSEKTIYYWVSRREIPFTKVGKHLRFDAESVSEHFKAKTPEMTGPCHDTSSLVRNKAWSLKIRDRDSASEKE